MRNIILTVVVGAAALVIGGTVYTAATAEGERVATVTSADVVDDTLRSNDYRNGSVHAPDLAPALNQRVQVGRVTRLEADGPYPGATDLGQLDGQGDNSDELVPADGAVHTVWVQCVDGKTALGGGFTLAADAGTAAAAATQVVASYPTQVDAGAIIYDPIAGDDAGSLRPNAWAVDAINNGASAVVVRPWVVCATVS